MVNWLNYEIPAARTRIYEFIRFETDYIYISFIEPMN